MCFEAKLMVLNTTISSQKLSYHILKYLGYNREQSYGPLVVYVW